MPRCQRLLLASILACGLLTPPRAPAQEEAPDAGDLLRQSVQQIATFNAEQAAASRKADLARYIPAGESVGVTLFYRVIKPAPAEEMEVLLLEDIHPFPVKYLAERGVVYREVESTVVGTGEYVRKGAPAYPVVSGQPQVDWIEWNQWKQKSETWAEERRASLPPDQFMVQARGTAVSHPGMEAHEEPGRAYVPQVDMAWLARNRQVLGAAAASIRETPDSVLGRAFEALREIDARASGPAWAPAPGGVLLSPAAAGALGDGFAIERVEYEPGDATVRVTGAWSALGLDADLLATTLRLAFGTQQIPYFSLDAHEPESDGRVAERNRVADELAERLGADADFARRFAEQAFEVKDPQGDTHRIAFLERVDPELARTLDRRLPMLMDLVFRPRWLARTRLGELLFIADQSLKELWHGAAVWTFAPSRTLAVAGSLPPKFWSERNPDREFLEQALGRSLSSPTSSRWWFTPGGEAQEGDRVLDLSQVQPLLQTERIGGTGKVTLDLQTGVPGLTVKQEIVLDPLAASVNTEDPWSKQVVESVNHNFDAYARAVPEWEALRQVFRAYVFAIWLQKHDPATGRRLLAELPPPRPPSRALPKIWPDPRLLVVRMQEGEAGLELAQATICGGVGFERPFLRSTPWTGAAAAAGAGAAGRGGSGSDATSLSLFALVGDGLVPEWSEDDAAATPAGYRAWRERLLRQRGLPWAWVEALLDPRELATFAGIAFLLVLLSWVRARRAQVPFTRTVAAASLVDLVLLTLVFTLTALYPDTYRNHTGPFTGWGVAVGVYGCIFAMADRGGRMGLIALVMTVVLIHTAFTPGWGEIVRGWTPLRLAVPPLEGSAGAALAADTVYALQAMDDGLALSRALEPRYAWYPLVWLLAAAGLALEVRSEVQWDRAKKAAAQAAAGSLPV